MNNKYLLILVCFCSFSVQSKKDLQLESLRIEHDNFVTDEKYKNHADTEKKLAKKAIEAIYNQPKGQIKEQAVYIARHKLAYAKLVAESELLQMQIEKERKELERLRLEILKADAAVARSEADKARLLLNLQAEEAERARLGEQRARQLANERQLRVEQARAEAEAAKSYAQARAEEASLAKQEAELAMEEIDMLRKQLDSLSSRKTEQGMVMTLGDFVFDSSSATLKQAAIDNFTKVLDFIDRYPNRKIRIEGHTDSSGAASYNLNLSQQRADAVKKLLIDFGIMADRIDAVGKGEEFPVASNNNAAGKAKNRRVDIIILDP